MQCRMRRANRAHMPRGLLHGSTCQSHQPALGCHAGAACAMRPRRVMCCCCVTAATTPSTCSAPSPACARSPQVGSLPPALLLMLPEALSLTHELDCPPYVLAGPLSPHTSMPLQTGISLLCSPSIAPPERRCLEHCTHMSIPRQGSYCYLDTITLAWALLSTL